MIRSSVNRLFVGFFVFECGEHYGWMSIEGVSRWWCSEMCSVEAGDQIWKGVNSFYFRPMKAIAESERLGSELLRRVRSPS